jgi:predicted MFS family arabinose efflux permease
MPETIPNKKPFTSYQRLIILLLTLTQFTVVLDFMVMSPLGDVLIKRLDISPNEFSILVSSYAIAAGVSGFLTAGFADRFDRKKILLFFYAGFIIGTLFCALSESYESLLLARIFTGIFGGVMSSISMAIVADLFSIDQRGRVMGFLQMGFGLSQILGIPISLYLATLWDWQAPFFLVVGMGALIFASLIVGLKPVDSHLQLKGKETNAFRHMFNTMGNKHYRVGFLATAFLSLGGYLLMPWGSTFAVNNIGISQSDLPLLFMVVGIATFAIMPLIGSLSDKMNKFYVFTASSVLMIAIILVYVHLPKVNLFMLIGVQVIMMCGIMARMVPAQALNSAIPAPEDRGAFMSINASLQQLAGGIAAFMGGLIVQQASKTSPLEHFDWLGYLVVAIILLNIVFVRRVYLLVSEERKY